MSREELLKSYLPKYYRKSKVVENLNYINSNELDRIEINIDETIKELIISTADKSLARWEKEFGLMSDSKLDTQIRRSRILAKYLMRPPCTLRTLKDIVRAFIYDVDIKEDYDNYSFDVILKTKEPVGNKLNYIIESIEEIKPAHLNFNIIITYLTEVEIKTSFIKGFSDIFEICGTLDVSGNPYEATKGFIFKEEVELKTTGLFSEEFLVASEETFIEGIGRTNTTLLGQNLNVTNVMQQFKVASENLYAEEEI